jgi:hypothetical protein
MDNFCAHFANLGGPNVLTERSFPLLDFGRDCCKTLETRIWSFGLPIATHTQPILPLLLHWLGCEGGIPSIALKADAGAADLLILFFILHVPDDGFRFWGTPPFLHFFEQCCAVLSVSPNWSHGSPKKILGSRPSATFMSWNKYVSHQMRCSEVSVSKVLLTSCRFWASFRAWPGIQLRHEMLTHAYSNSPLTVRKNVFIRSWMNFMNCEWQSHLPQFKLDRSVWLSCTSIERQKHTHKTAAQICRAVFGSLDFAGPLQGNTTIWCNLSLEKKTINNTCD